jgi:hypothetical protein
MRCSALPRLLIAGVMSAFLAACVNLGPRALDRDQLAYGHSIGENWKNQMLANLVKLRYVDMPVFVDVGQIVGGYTLETQVDGRIGFSDSLIGRDTQAIGGAGRFTDRPTITYMPKTGEDYLRSLLAPVEPSAVLALVLAGYSPKLLFNWSVESVNGVQNFAAARGETTQAVDPEFTELVELLSELQAAGAIGFELEHDPDTRHDVIFMFTEREVDPRVAEKRERVRELLNLEAGRRTFRVLYSPFALEERDVLAIQTRSILQTMSSLAGFVDVPADRVARAYAGYSVPPGASRPFRVRSSVERPEDAYAAYEYEGHWYWIDHQDLASKQVFTLMLFLTTLTNRRGSETAPVLTIPTS